MDGVSGHGMRLAVQCSVSGVSGHIMRASSVVSMSVVSVDTACGLAV